MPQGAKSVKSQGWNVQWVGGFNGAGVIVRGSEIDGGFSAQRIKIKRSRWIERVVSAQPKAWAVAQDKAGLRGQGKGLKGPVGLDGTGPVGLKGLVRASCWILAGSRSNKVMTWDVNGRDKSDMGHQRRWLQRGAWVQAQSVGRPGSPWRAGRAMAGHSLNLGKAGKRGLGGPIVESGRLAHVMGLGRRRSGQVEIRGSKATQT